MNRGAGLGLLGSNLLLLEVLALLFLGNCHLLLLCLAGSQCGIAIHQDTASVRTVNIIISLNILHLEVEQSLGVNELAQETGFKVKMGTGRTSGISTQTNGLAGSYRLIFLNQLFAHVAIQGFQTIGVADDYIAAISFALVGYNTDLAAECSTDCVADVALDVSSVMITMECSAIAEMAGYQAAVSRHTETAKVNLILFRHLNTIMSSISVIPLRIKCRGGSLCGLLIMKQTYNRKAVYCAHFLVHGSHTCQFVLCDTRSSHTRHCHHENKLLYYHCFHHFCISLPHPLRRDGPYSNHQDRISLRA